MNVPPFIPEPIEIPGSVAEQSRVSCLKFVRRTVVFHFLSALLVMAVGFVPSLGFPLESLLLMALGLLLILSTVRNLAKGYPSDLRISVALAPAFWITMGLAFGELARMGWPVWSPMIGLAVSLVYTFASGRDHSFVGHFVLSLVVSSILIGALDLVIHVPKAVGPWALAFNAVVLAFVVYDLAAILTRRLPKEEWGAVVDLYRDVLNFLTYTGRVWKHWQTHRIWSVPK